MSAAARSLLHYVTTLAIALAACAILMHPSAHAEALKSMGIGMGMGTVAGPTQDAPTTIFYPSDAAATTVTRGPFQFAAAVDGAAKAGNGRLIVISHGSGGAPWPLADLTRTWVNAGYTVAIPLHEGDNFRGKSKMGPDSWKLRPKEVSASIDAVAVDPRFGPLLDTRRVGVYGPSAGGFTALVLGGAVWSPSIFQQHCLTHTAEDFAACAGLVVHLRGNWLDSVKLSGTRLVHRLKYSDTQRYAHSDPRVVAVLAAVPMAASIDPASLAQVTSSASTASSPPSYPAIGLVRAGQDTELQPRFHIDTIRAACARCELVADLPQAGHDSLFSPWPQDFAATLGPQAVDPPGFERAQLPQAYERMRGFFDRHLLVPSAKGQ